MNTLVASNAIIAPLKTNYRVPWPYLQPNLKKLWLYALGDVINKLNVVPRQHLSRKTPYYKWFGTHYDFHNQPLLPFGCRVMAHVHISNQSKLSDNSVLHYYIGTAFRTKEGIGCLPKFGLELVRTV